jgi:hypothetical protein
MRDTGFSKATLLNFFTVVHEISLDGAEAEFVGLCIDDLIRSGFTPLGLPQHGTQRLPLRESWIDFFFFCRLGVSGVERRARPAEGNFPDITRTNADLGFTAARDSTCILYVLRN